MLKGKRLSILGDSISTYHGVSNDAESNATICGNPYFYREPFPREKTYWSLLMERLGLLLCVNNSWSGGNLTGRGDPISGVCRAAHLANERGERPDLVILFMGINDLGRRVSPDTFSADYERALATIRQSLPDAAICCVNIPDRDPYLKPAAKIFNTAIARAVDKAGDAVFLADLFSSRLNNDCYYMNTVDGLHPDEDGMRIIADVIEAAIRKNLC